MKRPSATGIAHSRAEVALERARQGLIAVFGRHAQRRDVASRHLRDGRVAPAPSASWPGVAVADTRGILRREALTPALAREVRETLAAGRRAFLAVSRRASALACDECGGVVRCEACGIALAYARASATLACRLCAAIRPLPDVCPDCRGHRLSPFGWGAERVEHAVRRRFPKARVARYDPEVTRGARAEASGGAGRRRHRHRHAGRSPPLRPTSFGLAGRLAGPAPARRIWRPSAPSPSCGRRPSACPDGRMVIQSQNPSHYAFAALIGQDLGSFYERELAFRRELGYPPFRRLAVVTVRGRTGEESQQLAGDIAVALRGGADLTVYPPQAGARGRARQVVVKGERDLPAILASALGAWPPSSRTRGIMTVEVDPSMAVLNVRRYGDPFWARASRRRGHARDPRS
jgi:primosomal protein N' (replication factor Y)